MYRSYPSISKYIRNSEKDWNDGPSWYIQEKMDGSQMTFYLLKDEDRIVFKCGNKEVGSKSSCFNKAISLLTLIKNKMDPNFIYYGESIQKNRHNVVQYSRVPKNYFILYDIFDISLQKYIDFEPMIEEAKRLGLEHSPTLYVSSGDEHPNTKIDELIESIISGQMESCLGGTPEGIVIKRNHIKSTKMKVVTDIFKEYHKVKKPKNVDILYSLKFLNWLGQQFNVGARFRKALQHLNEADSEITIHSLEEELDKDLMKEYKDELETYVWKEFNPYLCKYGRIGSKSIFTEYMSWINYSVEDYREVEHNNDVILSEIMKISKPYANEDRFLKVLSASYDKNDNPINFSQLKKNETKDYVKVLEKYRSQLDLDLMENVEIRSKLWNLCSLYIFAESRCDLERWYKQFSN
jgi:hypothetical protein